MAIIKATDGCKHANRHKKPTTVAGLDLKQWKSFELNSSAT